MVGSLDMASPTPIMVPSSRKPFVGGIAAFALHTIIAYTCALHLSQWLVFHWFGWIAPILKISISMPATDWYLQHFEVLTVIPGLVAGYINVARFALPTLRNYLHEGRDSIAIWAWTIPTVVLLYRMLIYRAPSSVLFGSSMTATKYFFDIQKVMPTFANPLASDPVRVWAQMSVTAPFYAGVAYSLGALSSQHALLSKLFKFEQHEEPTASS
jgi:hypothetical protein